MAAFSFRMSSWLFGLAILGFSTGASALPTRMVMRVYFSDKTFTDEVGWEARPTCSGGGGALSGRRTRFVVRETTPCQSGGGWHEVACYLDGRLTTCPATICNSPLVTCG